MQDRQISIACTITYALWALSLGLWVTSLFIDTRPLASAAILTAIAAATGTVRSYIAKHDQQVRTAMMVTSAVPPPEVTPLPRKR